MVTAEDGYCPTWDEFPFPKDPIRAYLKVEREGRGLLSNMQSERQSRRGRLARVARGDPCGGDKGASLSTWETVKNTGFLRKTGAENYGRRSQIAKNLGKSAILAC
jgi:hypothetical protein